MISYQLNDVKNELKIISEYIGSALPNNPVQENSYKEYYKNGNVQAYVSVFTSTQPYFSEKVRNKDYFLYKENYRHMHDFVHLSYLAEIYKTRHKEFIQTFSTFHKRELEPSSFKYDKLHPSLTKPFVAKPSKANPPKPIKLKKPSLIESKYQIKPALFKRLLRFLFLRKKKPNAIRKDFFYKDLNTYTKKQEEYYKQLNKYAVSKYSDEINEVKRHQQYLKNQEIVNLIRAQYLEWGDVRLIKKYFEYTLSKTRTKHSFYQNETLAFRIDKETSTLIVGLSVPLSNQYPRIESFRIVKKDVIAVPSYVNPKTYLEHLSTFAMSQIIHLTQTILHVDDAHRLNHIVFNLYRSSSLENKHCFKVITAPKENFDYIHRGLGLIATFKNTFGTLIDYESIQSGAVPYGV